jgi:hypothetical protein
MRQAMNYSKAQVVHPNSIGDDSSSPLKHAPAQRGAAAAQTQAADCMTFLCPAVGERGVLCKQWRVTDDRQYACEKILLPSWFQVTSIEVAGFDRMVAVLEWAQRRPDIVLIRGEHIGANRNYTRRDLQNFADAPRRWIALDFDTVLCPPEIAFPEDLGSAARYVRALLPAGFHDASCWVQATASAGIKDGVRLRLFFRLDQPVCSRGAKAWLNGCPVDDCLFQSVQPHFIAQPRFIPPASDPVSRRSLVQCGVFDRVTVPADFHAPARSEHRPSQATGRVPSSCAREELQVAIAASGGCVVHGMRAAFAAAGARGTGRHNMLVSAAGLLIRKRWPEANAVAFLTPVANHYFGDGDWTLEVQAAVQHASCRQAITIERNAAR